MSSTGIPGPGHQDRAAGLTASDQNINESPEDVSKKAQGHKANISNPNTSQASKDASQKALDELGGEKAFFGKQGKGE